MFVYVRSARAAIFEHYLALCNRGTLGAMNSVPLSRDPTGDCALEAFQLVKESRLRQRARCRCISEPRNVFARLEFLFSVLSFSLS